MTATVTEGHHAVLYVGDTATTTLTNAAMTNLDPATHLVYQLTDGCYSKATHNYVLDPTYAITPISGYLGTFTSNRLTGTLTMSTSNATKEPFTMSGKARSMTALLYAHDFSMSIKPKVVDTTAFNLAPPYQSNQRVINQLSGTIGTFFAPDEVAFTAPITEFFLTELTGDVQFALELYISANWSMFMWVKVDSVALKQVIEGLTDETIAFRGDIDADGRCISQS
jgi:hypothetical protein